MTDKLCAYFLKKIRADDNTIDDENAEIIYYGLQNLFGELPKGVMVLAIAWIFGVFELVAIGTVVLLVYRGFAGGIHLKTHVSCLIISSLIMTGGAYLAKLVIYDEPLLIYTLLTIINLILVFLYAPADTENRPIMKEKQMKRQKIESYIMVLIVYVLSSFIIKDQVICNLFMYMITIESLLITPLAYKLANNKNGDERRKEILASI